MTVRHDLNELKLRMYEAISHNLDRHPPPPEKISVALAVSVDACLDKGGGKGVDPIRLKRLNRAALQGTARRGCQRDDEDRARR